MAKSKKAALKSAKQARGGGGFLPLRMDLLQSEALATLGPHACKLLLDLCSGWRLGRNGAMNASWAWARERGWRSKATLFAALAELEESGLIVRTRQGGMHKTSMFALGWLAVDDCPDLHLDMRPTTGPLDYWKPQPVPKNAAPGTPTVPTDPV